MVTALKAPAKKSSSIAATGYDIATRTLRVQYHGNSKVYDHPDVPPEKIDEMHAAESIGQFINKHIKPHYPPVPHETA